ncbi:MAG: hypothetical protein MUF54_24075 [Polyangiaceae bacterium]|nr:hypothetical protein [Polyangiaceae bacterium]
MGGTVYVVRLTVGRWTHDDTHVISASRLYDLSRSEVFSAPDLIPADASCTRGEHAPCYVASENRFGTCFGGACRRR